MGESYQANIREAAKQSCFLSGSTTKRKGGGAEGRTEDFFLQNPFPANLRLKEQTKMFR